MENIFIEWVNGAIERAPELVVLVAVAYDLRKHLLNCIDHNQAVMDDLLRRFLDKE